MAGLFNEEPTVRLQRTASEQPQIRERREAPNVDTSGTERLIEGLTVYGSPLMNAATELLGILVTIRRQGAPRDINRFRQQLLGAIEAFRLRGLHLAYHPSVIVNS